MRWRREFKFIKEVITQKTITGRVVSAIVIGALWLQPATGYSGPLDSYIEGAKKEGSVRLGITIRQRSTAKSPGKNIWTPSPSRIAGIPLACIIVEGCRQDSAVTVTTRQVIYFGDSMNCEIDFAATTLRARLHPSSNLHDGQEVTVNFKSGRCVALPRESTNQ